MRHFSTTTKVSGLLITVIIAGLLSACDSRKELKNEVMDIHDEIMPRMDDLRNLKKQLTAKADSVGEKEAQAYLEIAEQVQKASDGMWEWMHNFEPDSGGTEQEVIRYLRDQKESIQKVRKDMLEAIDRAEKALK